MSDLSSSLPYSRGKNLGKPLSWGKFLGGLLLFSLLSVSPVQGCTYADRESPLDSQTPQTSQAPTSNPSPLISQSPMLPQVIADIVLADLAQRTSQPVSAFKVKSSESQNWPDSCLGLAQEDQMCAQVITPGWRVVVESGQKTWVYRTNQNGRMVLLES